MPEKIPYINEALAQARSMEDSGKFNQAEHVYRTILERHPTNKLVKKRLKSVQKIIATQGKSIPVSPSLGAGINVLVDLFKQGRLVEALNQGTDLSGRYPSDPTIHNILGVINARIGQTEAALVCYDRALVIKPDFAEVHNNRGNVLNRLGQHEVAIACFRKAVQTKPQYAEAHNNMGVALYDAGQVAEAVASYREALKVRPAYAEAHNNLGNALTDLGQSEAALASFNSALQINPRYSEAYCNMGDTLRSLGKAEEATRCFETAIQIRPDYAKAYCGLGASKNDQGLHKQAIESLRKAIQLQPDFAVAYCNLGNALSDLGSHDEAMVSYREALKINPDFAEVHSNLGNSLCEFGLYEEAIASYTRALELRPDFAEAHNNLSRLKTYTKEDPQIVEIQKRMMDEALTESGRMHLSFALGKVYEDLGDVDQSFSHLLQGNRLRKKAFGYDINRDRKLFEQIKLLFNADSLQAGSIVESNSRFTRQPIFIVGMPRSGTTLTEQILASHSQVWGGGELEALGRILTPVMQQAITSPGRHIPFETFVNCRDGYLADLESLPATAPYVTDKMPQNFRWAGFLLTTMPDVKIINVRRDPPASCWSMFKMQFRGHGYSNDLVDLANYYKLYFDLMGFWSEEFPGRIYDLDYEALTRNQESETRKLLEFCELDWEEQCLEFYKTKRAVRTPSGRQVRQKMYTGSSEAWRKYERHLGPLLESLGTQDQAVDPINR
jgi:tetratricopeptide (TPR) repeat protein